MNESRMIFIIEYIYIYCNGNIVIMLNFVTLLHKDCLKHNIPTNGEIHLNLRWRYSNNSKLIDLKCD
jgi:hypothetical protein